MSFSYTIRAGALAALLSVAAFPAAAYCLPNMDIKELKTDTVDARVHVLNVQKITRKSVEGCPNDTEWEFNASVKDLIESNKARLAKNGARLAIILKETYTSPLPLLKLEFMGRTGVVADSDSETLYMGPTPAVLTEEILKRGGVILEYP